VVGTAVASRRKPPRPATRPASGPVAFSVQVVH